jgi:hypothetical protein
MKLMTAALLSILSIAVQAESTHLATVTSDTDSNRHELVLETDASSNVLSLRILKFKENGEKGKPQQFFTPQLLNGGLVLMEKDGHQAVRLDSAKFSAQKGGNVILNYLHNGLTGKRHSVWLSLYFKNGSYRLFDMKNQPVNEIKFYGRYWIGKLVGINGVDFEFHEGAYKQLEELD